MGFKLTTLVLLLNSAYVKLCEELYIVAFFVRFYKSMVEYFRPSLIFWNVHMIYIYKGSSWSWSYGSWIYNYLCNQCLSPLNVMSSNPTHAWCTHYTIMWSSLSGACDRSVVFSRYSSFLHSCNNVVANVAGYAVLHPPLKSPIGIVQNKFVLYFYSFSFQ